MSQSNWPVNYDQIAQTYDRRYERNDYADVERALQEFVGNQPELCVLEVGCGTGHWLQALQMSGSYVTGLDFSAKMLARAQKRLPEIDLIRGRANYLPWSTASFDRVFCINAIHHFPDKP